MRTPSAVLILLTGCLLVATGCKSNNDDGRLVGRWQAVNMPGLPPGVTAYWTFGADKSFTFVAQGPGGQATITGTYRLSTGDKVYIENLSESVSGHKVLTSDMTVNGDQMTTRDPDGTTCVFRRATNP